MTNQIVHILTIYRDSCVKAGKTAVSQIVLIPLIIVGYFIFDLLYAAIINFQLGIAGGFLLGLVHLALITYIYKWLLMARDERLPRLTQVFKKPLEDDPWAHVKKKNRGLWFQEIFEFDVALFSLIINAAFPIFIVELLVSLTSFSSLSLPAYVKLGIVFLFNPLPEVILIRGTNGLNAISEALEFIRSHLFAWFAPMILFFAPLLFLLGDPIAWFQTLVLLFANTEVLLPGELLGDPMSFVIGNVLLLGSIPASIIGAILGGLFALFRLELFDRLQSSPSRR